VTAHANALVDDPGAPGFAWAVPFGAHRIAQAIAGHGRFTLVHEIGNDLYTIQHYRRQRPRRWLRARGTPTPVREVDAPARTLPENVAATFQQTGGAERWASAGGTAGASGTSQTPQTLPILMYHRVSPTGAPTMRRWRVTPAELEQQLAYLSSVGYRSVSLEAWRHAVATRRRLPGRPIALTFDDGYADLERCALPLLRRYGFEPTLFVVTGCVGGVNAWDSAVESIPLMDWGTLRRMAGQGVEIGAHTATHAALTALPDAAVISEIVGSRMELRRQLGQTPKLFAAPYGLRDAGIDALVGACGFELAVTCAPAQATTRDPLLCLPRLEVLGGMDLGAFVRLLTP